MRTDASAAPQRLWWFVLLSLLLHLLVVSLLLWEKRTRIMPAEAIMVELLPPAPSPPPIPRVAEPQPVPHVAEPPPLLTSEQSVTAPAATPHHTPVPPPQKAQAPTHQPPIQKSPPAPALRPPPLPAPAPEPPSAGGEGQGDGKIMQLHNAYLAQIAAQLMQQKCRLFSPASMRDLLGVELILRLDQGGHMQKLTITRSSGSAAVDHAVAQLVARAGRFPPLPPEIDAGGTIIVRFRERDVTNGGGCPG